MGRGELKCVAHCLSCLQLADGLTKEKDTEELRNLMTSGCFSLAHEKQLWHKGLVAMIQDAEVSAAKLGSDGWSLPPRV